MDRRAACGDGGEDGRRYKGVRRRRWGKWVSEIRVPGTRERLWLGSYATAEAAAVAHDAAVRLLRKGDPPGAGGLINFPGRGFGQRQQQQQLSPRSVQRVASDAGMAADARLVERRERDVVSASAPPGLQEAAASAGIGREQGAAYVNWRSSSGSGGGGDTGEQLVYGELSVDDMEILML
ncbi:ethylene-responsive transcription factor ERF019 [Brachypodium distachyon]|uniref:AP2/ERF domain-containing protein n=1 Tax=Brachypodium distachyon TaxID=15368 RepID=I1HJB2_BRADI|nr:ethylene-responsive transcription factor ERF019 [Brachypodium distachyon]KQK06196.1 hypothetical protein BRADI_2g25050v3 [Brachypodium distachyon]|eukprot:XP_003566226.1 ethylene-responsive transcription factor ERF019 [Brachypodium distachyon]